MRRPAACSVGRSPTESNKSVLHWSLEMGKHRFAENAARMRAQMRALEVPNPKGWDAAGDGVVIFTRTELVALKEICRADRKLIAASARGWARRVPAARRKRRLIDWLIEREAELWELAMREVDVEKAAETRMRTRASTVATDD